MKPSLLLLLVALLGACAAPTSDDDTSAEATEGAFSSTSWIKIFDCDGGAVVDVNRDERRHLQLVIKNHDAAEYILAHGNDYMRGMERNAKGELIMSGSTDRGVFAPGDLFSFRGYGNQQWPIYDVIKYPGGVKVSVLANDRTEAANWWFPSCR